MSNHMKLPPGWGAARADHGRKGTVFYRRKGSRKIFVGRLPTYAWGITCNGRLLDVTFKTATEAMNYAEVWNEHT